MIELLKDKYNIIRKIGQGGMALIYLAQDKFTNEKVAIKVVEPSTLNDFVKRKRFEQEIRLMKKVDSPYVVKLFEAEVNEKYAYIVMEYVDGYILKDYISTRTHLTVDEAIDFAGQLALGFDEIHKAGVIHRDIKSQNVMVTDNGRIKIVDFGIAIDDETEKLTKTDMLIGSPQYVSPELINQEKPTVASDVYAFGILLYEMVAGEVPFTGKDPVETLRKHQERDMPRITKSFTNVPQSVENTIIKCTAKKPEQRFESMYAIYKDLKTVLSLERANEQLINLDNRKKKSFIELVNSKWTIVGMTIILAIILIVLIVVIAMKG